ncbi:MAG: protein translocase subunit SecF [Actinomycetota bacterium]|nr:protein translocase subunit SecF [Actinomycetota bacterium]MDQ6948294.1 protein translocase subunit SecF [Actinomycetota bacterium]
MIETKHSLWTRLYRGETSFDFVGRRSRWFVISGAVIAIGLISLVVQGLNFGIEFKGGTVWEVRSNASVAHVRDVIGQISPDLRQSTIEVLTDRATGNRTLRISAHANTTKDKTKVNQVSAALAKLAGVDINQVALNDVGPTWGHDITQKAERALVIFLVAVVIYITFRFEGKMAIAALIALVHDILVTVGIYSLSGFQVTPATVIAFLTILGYSLYDTIVVFDKIEENTKGLAASGRITYTETVNLSMNQVLMRSINTSVVAIMPILSVLVIGAYFLGASALQDFGLALFIGLLTGAYSSIFIAAPILAVMKEREPRYSQIRQRLANRASMTGLLTPAAAASGELLGASGGGRSRSGGAGVGSGGGGRATVGPRAASKQQAAGAAKAKASAPVLDGADNVDISADEVSGDAEPAVIRSDGKPAAGAAANGGSGGSGSGGTGSAGGARSSPKPRPGAANRSGGGGGGGSRPGPRPRKKGRRR